MTTVLRTQGVKPMLPTAGLTQVSVVADELPGVKWEALRDDAASTFWLSANQVFHLCQGLEGVGQWDWTYKSLRHQFTLWDLDERHPMTYLDGRGWQGTLLYQVPPCLTWSEVTR